MKLPSVTPLGALLALVGGLVAAVLGWYALPENLHPVVRYSLVLLFFLVPAATSIYNEHTGATSRGKEIASLRQANKEANARHASSIVEQLLRQMCVVLGGERVKVRANVMLVHGDELAIKYHHNMAQAADIDLRFRGFQGCAGHAWGMGQMTCCDLKAVSNDDLAQTWKLNATQRAVTKDLGSIISAPIRSIGHPDRVIGVLSFDSNEGFANSRFDDEDIQERVLETAQIVANLLKMGEIVTD